LIITINDTCTFDLALIITGGDTHKNQPKRFDSDNQINVSRLIVILATHVRGTALRKNPLEKVSQTQALDPYTL